jgi:hypothetical protein
VDLGAEEGRMTIAFKEFNGIYTAEEARVQINAWLEGENLPADRIISIQWLALPMVIVWYKNDDH